MNQNNNTEQAETKADNLEQTKEMGSADITNSKGSIHCLTIVGQIEGHMLLPQQNKATKYEHVIPQLVTIEEDEGVDGLIVILNTVGGDVEAGLAIAEMIASMRKPTVSLVLGGGHSIGVPLAVSANRSFIAPSATMTVHPIRLNGTVIGVPQTYEYFTKTQDRVVNFVTKNSNISREKFLQLMMTTGEMANDVGSNVLGEDAVKYGLIDEIGGISQALDYLYGRIAENKKANEEKQENKQ